MVTDPCGEVTEKQVYVLTLASGTEWLVILYTNMDKTRGKSSSNYEHRALL